MCGNGGLTIGVDPAGKLSICRWPGPGDANQLSGVANAPDRPSRVLEWGIGFSEKTLWLDSAARSVTRQYVGAPLARIACDFDYADPDMEASQCFFVCPQRDVLVAHVAVSGAGVKQILWSGSFAPCLRQVPEWPGLNDAFGFLNGFASYTPDRGKTVISFRPHAPGRKEWRKAEELASLPGEKAAGEWPSFGDGVWIAYGSPNEKAGLTFGSDGETEAAVGPCSATLALVPTLKANEASATVIVAFAKDCASATENLNAALDDGYEKLAQETDAYWKGRLTTAPMPRVDDKLLLDACARDLLILLQCADRRSGAIVRSPVESACSALDWMRDSPWTTLAMDMAGYGDLAERHTLFCADALRKEGKRGKPYGSVPEALCTGGADGVPHVILDLDAVAWTVASCYRHASLLEGPARLSYLTTAARRITGAGDFLASWADARTRLPLYSFNPALARDVPSQESLLTSYMGIDAVIRISEAVGSPVPDEWARRKRDLDAAIRFQCVDKNGVWKSEFMLPFWQPEIDKTELPQWDNVMERRLNAAKRAGKISVSTLCDAALVWNDRPDKLAHLKAKFNDLAMRDVNALDAARHFIAASLVYAAPRKLPAPAE